MRRGTSAEPVGAPAEPIATLAEPVVTPAEPVEAHRAGHQAISYCPFCAEETLFPLETGWECRSCLRAFSVKFLGLSTSGRTSRESDR